MFDTIDGATLTVIDPSSTFGSSGLGLDDEHVRIVGLAGSEVVTLERCFLAGVSTKSNGLVERRYRVSAILSGAHFDANEPLKFTCVSLQLTNLVQWVGRSSLNVDLRPKAGSGEAERSRVSYALIAAIETNAKDGSIAVTFPVRWQTDYFSKFEVEHKCAIEYRFRKPELLAKIMEICNSLRNLVTICVRSPAAILDTRLNHSDLDRPISLYTQWVGASSSREQELVHRLNMPLTFDDIGGVEGIRAWLNLSNKYSELIALLVSHWYTPPLYQEQRYFNAIVAAEMLLRIRQGKQDIKLGVGLEGLTRDITSLFEPLVGDARAWTREVVQTRDNHVVHPGLRGNKDGLRLYLLSETIYALVVFTLLRECGVSIHSLKKSHDHRHFKRLAADIVDSS